MPKMYINATVEMHHVSMRYSRTSIYKSSHCWTEQWSSRGKQDTVATRKCSKIWRGKLSRTKCLVQADKPLKTLVHKYRHAVEQVQTGRLGTVDHHPEAAVEDNGRGDFPGYFTSPFRNVSIDVKYIPHKVTIAGCPLADHQWGSRWQDLQYQSLPKIAASIWKYQAKVPWWFGRTWNWPTRCKKVIGRDRRPEHLFGCG